MRRTTGRLSLDSGYTTKVSTERPSCFTVTHSRCRGDFSSCVRAQSWAQTACANRTIRMRVMGFMTPSFWLQGGADEVVIAKSAALWEGISATGPEPKAQSPKAFLYSLVK